MEKDDYALTILMVAVTIIAIWACAFISNIFPDIPFVFRAILYTVATIGLIANYLDGGFNQLILKKMEYNQ